MQDEKQSIMEAYKSVLNEEVKYTKSGTRYESPNYDDVPLGNAWRVYGSRHSKGIMPGKKINPDNYVSYNVYDRRELIKLSGTYGKFAMQDGMNYVVLVDGNNIVRTFAPADDVDRVRRLFTNYSDLSFFKDEPAYPEDIEGYTASMQEGWQDEVPAPRTDFDTPELDALRSVLRNPEDEDVFNVLEGYLVTFGAGENIKVLSLVDNKNKVVIFSDGSSTEFGTHGEATTWTKHT